MSDEPKYFFETMAVYPRKLGVDKRAAESATGKFIEAALLWLVGLEPHFIARAERGEDVLLTLDPEDDLAARIIKDTCPAGSTLDTMPCAIGLFRRDALQAYLTSVDLPIVATKLQSRQGPSMVLLTHCCIFIGNLPPELLSGEAAPEVRVHSAGDVLS